MRILVFGAGVLGSMYAGRLAAAGLDVALLARGERLETLCRSGLVLFDEVSHEEIRPHVRVVADMRAEDDYDLVLVLVRADQALEALPLLATNRNVSSFLLLHNQASGPARAAAELGQKRVLLGFPGASGARDGSRVRYRLIPEQKTTLGEIDGRITPRLRQIAAVLRSAGFPVALSRRIDAGLKTHAVFVTAIAGAIYAAGGTCAALSEDPAQVASLVRAVRGGFRGLRRLGVPIEPWKLATLFLWLPLPVPIQYWRSYLARPEAELIFARHARAASEEMLELVEQLRVLMRGAGPPAPDLERAWSAVQRHAAGVTAACSSTAGDGLARSCR